MLPKLEMARETTALTSGVSFYNEEKGANYGWLRLGSKGYSFRLRELHNAAGSDIGRRKCGWIQEGGRFGVHATRRQKG